MAKVLLQAITASILVAAVFCCSCLPQTWPEHYCTADYVARVTVLNNGPVIGRDRAFRVNVRFYKTTVHPNFVNRYFLFTPSDSAACGVNFEAGRSYLITGYYTISQWGQRIMRTGRCSYQQEVSGYLSRFRRPSCRRENRWNRRSEDSRD